MPRKGKIPVSSDAVLTVTAQQSRFDSAGTDDSASNHITVKDLTISVGGQEILKNATFQLQSARHYVLVGRNGTGKSTFLRAIATRQIPSIPQGLRILLLGQTQISFDQVLGDLALKNETVVQRVVRSDRYRERLVLEAKDLADAFESTETVAAIKAYRRIRHNRLVERLDDARHLAAGRSGARGSKARKVVAELETELADSLSKLVENLQELPPSQIADETQESANMLADIQSSLELMSASAAEAKARSVLLGLGFSVERLDEPVAHLSGGWKTRCELACILCKPTDLLLLDEPTNFLDLPSIIWLERYIQSLEHTTVIVITHDRAFADAVAEELFVLREQSLKHFRSSLSAYETERIATYKYLSRMQEAQDRQKKHMQSTIDQNVRAAKRAGDDKRLKQAVSRKKKLDERMGMEVSAKGTRFKLNRDRPGFHTSSRADIDVPTYDPPPRMSFPMAPADLRFPGALVSLEGVCFGYSSGDKTTPVLRDIDLTIHPRERVGIAGLNGSGKTTLVSLLIGLADEISTLVPSKGHITRHPRARFERYSQQAVEELTSIGAGDSHLTPLSHMVQSCGEDMSEKDARGLLASVGIQGQVASDVPIAHLSGGQKVRLALAKLVWRPPQLLILDEITTHLDSDTILALIGALRRYEGALLVITHDRYFMRCMVEGESPNRITDRLQEGKDSSDSTDEEERVNQQGTVYRLSKGKLVRLEGGMRQYEDIASKVSVKLGLG